MSAIRRAPAALLACLAAAVLSACGSGGPAAKIGDLSIQKYVALGDGYASSPHAGETDPANGCLRSEASYPARLAEELDVEDFVDATCAFARSQDLTRPTRPIRATTGTVPAQVDELSADTDLVTVTVGLSDRTFGRRVFEVCDKTCEDDGGVPVAELGADLQKISKALSGALKVVGDKAPDARVIVVGYPTLLPAEGKCAAMPDLSQERADLVNAILTQLNVVLEAAAREADADFVDVEELSKGHDMCSTSPWVQGSTSAAGEPPRFHPLAPLNDAIAAQLAADLEP